MTISLLKDIYLYQKPLDKLLLISKLSISIVENVNAYWDQYKECTDNKLLDINADDLLSIFIFILCKSQFSDILIHMKIIKDFTTTISKSSMMGYYYTTIEASLAYIKEMTKKG